jgi:hypothetical protein
MTSFSSGKYALMVSDRSGQTFPWREMVREWNGAWVHFSEYEPKQPQLQPRPTSADPQALTHARPSRTALPTPAPLDTVPFSTAGTTTLTVSENRHQRKTGDAVRFYQVKEAVGGVSVAALELNTTLNGDITSTAATITLTDASEFPTSGYIVIEKYNSVTAVFESETIEYTGKSGNDLTGCTRGTAAPSYGKTPVNTEAGSHSSGAKVYGSYIITIVETSFTNDANSTETYSNSFTCTLVNAATGTAKGGGFFVFGGPVNDRP